MSEGQEELPADEESPLVAWLRDHYEGVTVFSLAAFMLWVRMQAYDRFIQGGEVFFSGNDAYYHLREVRYTVRNWPATMPYDPWTNYPYGTSVNQFGTLYDQVVATAALLVGLGSPSEKTVGLVLLVSPAILGALTAFPAYYAGKRVGGTYGGLFGVLVLALLPGSIVARTNVGFADHQAAEILAMMTTVLALLVALKVADDEKPVYELVVDRDLEALRRPVGWAAIAGVAMGLYVWTWPPAIMLMGIFAVFLAVRMAGDYYHGGSPEPIGFVGVVSMSVAGVMSLLPMSSVGFSPNGWGLIQPLTGFGTAAGCVFMAWLAREWDDRDLERWQYPLSVGGVAAAGTALVSVLLPGLWATVSVNYQRFIGFSAGADTRTIREAQPFLAQTIDRGISVTAVEVIYIEYGAMFFTAMLGLAYMLGRPLFMSTERADHATFLGGLTALVLVWQFDIGGLLLGVVPVDVPTVTVETAIVAVVLLVAMLRVDHDVEELFVAVWLLFMTSAAFTQTRFNYYLALAVVVMNAYLVGEFLEVVNVVDAAGKVADEVEPYQVMVLMLIPLVVLPVMVVPVTYAEVDRGQQTVTRNTQTSIEAANRTSPSSVDAWEPSLEWMANNTPREGTYGGANNEMDPYGTYDEVDDYDYPEGTYGVMSWWDYGHWITVHGERMPNANPFQQGATHAANYLLETNETRANEILARGHDGAEETRYVVVDWQMADTTGKFSAPTVFYDEEENVSFRGDYVEPYIYSEQGRPQFRLNTQRYYEAMMIRLYRFNASSKNPEPIVFDWRERTVTDPQTGEERVYREAEGRGVQTFRSLGDARDAVENDSTSTIGGVGPLPRERVSALEHYRLVHASESTTTKGGVYFTPISKVKVFERVPGATITGTGPANATVRASVDMRILSRNATFTYTQRVRTDDEGRFTLTVPYSTTGYENWGPEQGYTNVSVRATGPYRISTDASVNPENGTIYTYSDTVNVSEAKVIGEDTEDIEGVELSYTEVGQFPVQNNSSNESSAASLSGPAELPDDPTADDGAVATDGGEPSAPGADASTGEADAATGSGERAAAGAGVVDDLHEAEGEAPTGSDSLPAGMPARLALVLLVTGTVLLEVRE